MFVYDSYITVTRKLFSIEDRGQTDALRRPHELDSTAGLDRTMLHASPR